MQLSQVISFLEHAYDVLNEHYFDNSLPRVVVNVAQMRGCYGYFTTSKVWQDSDDCYFEISITPDYGLSRDIYSVISTLQHECCHCYNATRNPPIKDCSRHNTYHNKRFRDTAEARDLLISYDSRIGWSITKPSPNLIKFIDEQGWGDIDLSRITSNPDLPFGKGGKGGTTKPTHIRKYQCPSCRSSVRASKEVHISCDDCHLPMELVEKCG